MGRMTLYEWIIGKSERSCFWIELGLFGVVSIVCLLRVLFDSCRAKLSKEFQGVRGLPRASLVVRKRLRG